MHNERLPCYYKPWLECTSDCLLHGIMADLILNTLIKTTIATLLEQPPEVQNQIEQRALVSKLESAAGCNHYLRAGHGISVKLWLTSMLYVSVSPPTLLFLLSLSRNFSLYLGNQLSTSYSLSIIVKYSLSAIAMASWYSAAPPMINTSFLSKIFS